MRKILLPILLLLLTLAACSAGSPAVPAPTATPTPGPPVERLDRVVYKVTEVLTLVNDGPGAPQKQNVWLALIGDIAPYQEVLDAQISPARWTSSSDEYGNRYAEFDLSDMAPGQRMDIRASYRVAVNRVAADLLDCQGDVPDAFNRPELHIESNNPQIVDLATSLGRDANTACQQIRAIYDHIGNTLVYTYNGQNWGAQAALGEMGADCTEYASLMIALSRASGLPARYLEGVVYFPRPGQAAARTEHAWLEVYLPGAGWTPMDPTLGRSSVSRVAHFAQSTPDHIIVTRGRNPSTLRGGSYYSHLYWPGNSTRIRVADFGWTITPVEY